MSSIKSPAVTKGLAPAYPGYFKAFDGCLYEESWCQLCEEHAHSEEYQGYKLCATCVALMKGILEE